MRVLIACECSGRIRETFLARGHDAYSCDLERHMEGFPCSDFKRHIVGDVRLLLRERWDLVIAHPPCTYISMIGGCSKNNPGRYEKTKEACKFFLECYRANAHRICIENPIPMKDAIKLIRVDYSQIIHPWHYGAHTKKSTCLWLRRLPRLKSTNVVDPNNNLVSVTWLNKRSGRRVVIRGTDTRYPPSVRQQMRSVTFQGIADAMAEQWGRLPVKS